MGICSSEAGRRRTVGDDDVGGKEGIMKTRDPHPEINSQKFRKIYSRATSTHKDGPYCQQISTFLSINHVAI
jgi:hypothetical protein